jgi:cation transport regulator ChaC
MASMSEDARIDYVFGYGSLVELTAPLAVGGRVFPAVPGRLRDYRRGWGVAMNNWETTEAEKHFVDPESGLKPRIAVAYLDVDEAAGGRVNGLAIPVDERRLAELDVREVNYLRVDVSACFEPVIPHRVFTFVGTGEARARRRLTPPAAEIFVSREYVARIRRGFAALGPDALPEYERTTDPLPFPERDLELRYPALPGSA